MAKKKKKTSAPRKPTRKERSRAEREARMNRRIVAIAIAVGVLIVGVLAYGYIAEVVIKGRQPVATVNGVPVLTSDWQARVRELRTRMSLELGAHRVQRMEIDTNDPSAEMLLQQLDQAIRDLETQLSLEYSEYIGGQVLEQMAQEELFRQEADRLGLAVSLEEVDRAVEQFFGFDREAAASSAPPISDPLTQTLVTTPTTGMTEEDFQRQYQDYVNMVLKPSGLGVEGFRAMIEAFLLNQRVQTEIESSAPTAADQVQIRYIASPLEEEATDVMERLEQGEDWDSIVEELEADEEGTAHANEMDWQPEAFVTEQFGEEIRRTVFEASVGA